MWLGKLKRLDRAIDACSGAACEAAQGRYEAQLYSLPHLRPRSRLECVAACAAAAYFVRGGHYCSEVEADIAVRAIRLVARAIRSRDTQAAALMHRLPRECSGLTGSAADAVEAIARGAGPR